MVKIADENTGTIVYIWQSIYLCHPNISIHVCFWKRDACDRKRHVTRLQRSCSPFAVHVFFFELSGFRYLCSLEAKSAENLIFFPFLWCCANVGVVSRERREPPTYLSSKNKKLGDRIDSRVQLVWWLQVMGSCYNQSVWNAGNQSFSHSFCLKWRTSNFCVIHDDGEHVDFFSRKPKSI